MMALADRGYYRYAKEFPENYEHNKQRNGNCLKSKWNLRVEYFNIKKLFDGHNIKLYVVKISELENTAIGTKAQKEKWLKIIAINETASNNFDFSTWSMCVGGGKWRR